MNISSNEYLSDGFSSLSDDEIDLHHSNNNSPTIGGKSMISTRVESIKRSVKKFDVIAYRTLCNNEEKNRHFTSDPTTDIVLTIDAGTSYLLVEVNGHMFESHRLLSNKSVNWACYGAMIHIETDESTFQIKFSDYLQ